VMVCVAPWRRAATLERGRHPRNRNGSPLVWAGFLESDIA
jgi:hypothetical protein